MNIKKPDSLSRQERLKRIATLFCQHRAVTTDRIASELQVSPRTVYRDLCSLERSGELRKRYSKHAGCYIVEQETQQTTIPLTLPEAIALYMTMNASPVEQTSCLTQDLAAGWEKIKAALPTDVSRALTKLENRISGPPLGPISIEQRSVFDIVLHAMRFDHQLSFAYDLAESSDRITVAPYALHFLHPVWYLVGRMGDYDGVEAFELSRIEAVEIAEERFRFPKKFCLDRYFEEKEQSLTDLMESD